MGLMNFWYGSSEEDQLPNQLTVRNDIKIDKTSEPIFVKLVKLDKELDKYLSKEKSLLELPNNNLSIMLNKLAGKVIVSDDINPNTANLLNLSNLIMKKNNNTSSLLDSKSMFNDIESNKDGAIEKFGDEFFNDYKAVKAKFDSIENYNVKISDKISKDLPSIFMSEIFSKIKQLDSLVEKIEPCAEILMQGKFGSYSEEIKDYALDNLPPHIVEVNETNII